MCLNFQRRPAQFREVCTSSAGPHEPGEVLSLQAYRRLVGFRHRPARVLLVEPDAPSSAALQRGLAPIADVVASSSFEMGRFILRQRSPDLLVTNLRLSAYNGLHLVFIAAPKTRSVVYSTAALDRMLALEAQRHEAFYESGSRLLTALPAYVNAILPAHDRRDVTLFDRRFATRGGRRAPDILAPAER